MAAQVFDLERTPRAGAGSRVLTQWRAARQAERTAQAAQAEQRAAGGRLAPLLPRRPGVQLVQDMPAKAFAAGGTDRLSAGWVAFNTGINADLDGALQALRARSRDWAVNTDMGRRYISLVQDNVVGPEAPRLQVRATLADGQTQDEAANQAVEDAWWRWCQRGACEVTGQLSFADVCRTVAASAAREGEFLSRRIRSARASGISMGFALQLLDVDRIAHVSASAAGQNVIRLGVEIDPLGRPVAVHLNTVRAGDPQAALTPTGRTERVAIDDVLHGFILERPEQVRGYPWPSAVLLSADQLATFKRYALIAAKIGAAKMGFYTTSADAVSEPISVSDLRDATGQLVQDVEAGMLEALPPGVDFKSFDPAYPHQAFDGFVAGHERGIAAGLNVAHHNLTGNMNGVNYSSARIAELAERSHWRSLQRWFIDVFVRPVYADWLRMALLTQSIRLPSGAPLPADRFDKFFQASTFQPRSWAWVDPRADMDAATTALQHDMRSLRQITDETGVDLEEVLADKARLLAKYQQLGLTPPAWLTGQPAAPAATAQPAAA